MAVGVLSVCLMGMNPVAQAGMIFNASVGGAPAGVNYANFDGVPLGNAGGMSDGITVSFTTDGQAVQGSNRDFMPRPICPMETDALR